MKVQLPTDHHVVPRWIKPTGSLRGELFHKATPLSALERGCIGQLEQCWPQVHEVDKVLHDPACRNRTRQSAHQGRMNTQVVAVRFATRDSRYAIVTRQNDQGLIQLSSRLQFLKHHPQHCISRQNFPKVVTEVTPDFGHIGQ